MIGYRKDHQHSRGAFLALAGLLAGVALAGSSFGASNTAVAMAPELILDRMEARFLRQVEMLQSYQGQRRYTVSHPLLKESAYWLVQEKYSARGEKNLVVLERRGSSIVQKRVFDPLLQVEQQTEREAVRPQVDLSRQNYEFAFVRYDGAENAYVFKVSPRGDSKYLLRGTIWINAQDFGVQRIEGEPATKHSSMIRSVRFVHEFARFGEFWLPVRHRSETELYLLGKAILEIDYFNYRWQPTLQGGQR